MTLNEFPVGTVIHSMLTEAQFQAQVGVGWILSDGRSITGSLYSLLTGATTVPDMRGRFLRAKNNGSTINPDGDLALGTNSADKFRSHTHISNTYNASGSNGVYPQGTDNSGLIGSTTPTGATGGNETAPVSTTVNIFIKIN